MYSVCSLFPLPCALLLFAKCGKHKQIQMFLNLMHLALSLNFFLVCIVCCLFEFRRLNIGNTQLFYGIICSFAFCFFYMDWICIILLWVFGSSEILRSFRKHSSENELLSIINWVKFFELLTAVLTILIPKLLLDKR